MSLIVVMEREVTAEFIPSWIGIDRMRLGRWGEQWLAMALTQRGFDTYIPAVDDRSVDLLVRAEPGASRFIELQTKTVRLDKSTYVFLRKRHFQLGENRYLGLVVLQETEAEAAIYLIPSLVWREPTGSFVSRDYVDKKSEPEFGLTVTRSGLWTLEPYRLKNGQPFAF